MQPLTTASTTYYQDKDGEFTESSPYQKGDTFKKESRFFSKLKQTITDADIEREREYQEHLRLHRMAY